MNFLVQYSTFLLFQPVLNLTDGVNGMFNWSPRPSPSLNTPSSDFLALANFMAKYALEKSLIIMYRHTAGLCFKLQHCCSGGTFLVNKTSCVHRLTFLLFAPLALLTLPNSPHHRQSEKIQVCVFAGRI
jgi:hypothetical protein